MTGFFVFLVYMGGVGAFVEKGRGFIKAWAWPYTLGYSMALKSLSCGVTK